MARKAHRRLLDRKVGYMTLMEVADKVIELAEMEGTMYRILLMSNKAELSRMLGHGKDFIGDRIDARRFTLGELSEIFRALRDFKEEDYKRARIERVRKYPTLTLSEFSRRHVGITHTVRRRLRKIREDKENGKKETGGDQGSLDMEGGDGDR